MKSDGNPQINSGLVDSGSAKKTVTLMYLFLGVAALIWVVRWLPIVRVNGDFGISFEASARVAHGEVWGRDFFVTVPPLSYYPQAAIYLLTHHSVWSENIHLFGTWLITLMLGIWIGKRLKVPTGILLAGGILAMTLSTPAFNCGLAYSYIATAWVEVTLLLLLVDPTSGPSFFRTFVMGVCMGLCFMTKHNVGLFMTAFFGTTLIGLGVFSWRSKWGELVKMLTGYCAGFWLTFGALFAIFASYSSAANVWKILFQDGPSGRGGLALIITRTIPRPVFSDLGGTVVERVIEAGASIVFFLAICFLSFQRLRNTGAVSEEPKSERVIPKAAYGYLAVLLVLSVLSLFDLPSVREVGSAFASLLHVRTVGIANFTEQIFYELAVAIGLSYLVAGMLWPRRLHSNKSSHAILDTSTGIFMALFCLCFSAAVMTSNINYFSFVAPAVVPFLVYVCYVRLRVKSSVIYWVSALCLPGYFLSTVYTESFCRYTRLPENSPFQGMWAGPVRTEEITTNWEKVHPLIEGRTTLWLTKCGPQSAYGGRPVPNVTGLSNDTYGVRVESDLFARWNRALPERVVKGPYYTAAGSLIFQPDNMTKWLQENYRCVYSAHGLEVWSLSAQKRENL